MSSFSYSPMLLPTYNTCCAPFVNATSQFSDLFEHWMVSIVAGVLQFVMKNPETVGLISLLILSCIFAFIVHTVVQAMQTLSLDRNIKEERDRSSKIETRKTLPHGGEFEKSDRAPRRPPTRR